MNAPDSDRADDDTEPLPPIGAELFGSPISADPPPFTDFSSSFAPAPKQPRIRKPSGRTIASPNPATRHVLAGAASAALVAVVVVAAVLLWPEPADSSGDAPSQAPSTAGSAEDSRLRGLIPAGFTGADCRPEPRPPGTAAHLACGPNADPGGPASSSFLLAERDTDLQPLLTSALDGAQVVTCPGRIQSPGPWRRNATPTQVAGTLICATLGSRATVAWTTDATDLVSVTRAGDNGPTLPQLYTWWATHS